MDVTQEIQLENETRNTELIVDKIYTFFADIDDQAVNNFRNSLRSLEQQRLFDQNDAEEKLRIVALSRLSEIEIQLLLRDEITIYLPGLHDIRQTVQILRFITRT
ncbi:MAG: hypothetical protein A2V81_01665 [Candidatus Abawacabacteria bacterium RBG_16_42_10]|uniref:Uncharacterized protein n=1 Tax=Candidatus Abawacabacteria bacterium RBG_16_42_10 TaxID=1817814 RepID=A0A1F4XJH6_9BACT|nr:MAG: hypothetical protein A2V81_01665 [Candidatus Abawacabacteria bacterium RBG_16_42_10]